MQNELIPKLGVTLADLVPRVSDAVECCGVDGRKAYISRRLFGALKAYSNEARISFSSAFGQLVSEIDRATA